MNTQKIMNLVFVAIGVSTLATIALTLQVSGNIGAFSKAAEQRYLSYQLADELRQSSDDLTRLGRTYAVTADAQYENMYMDVLAIRNGSKPLPKKYHQIYWDLVLQYGDKPKPDGPAISMDERLHQLGFTEQELALLDRAKANSDGLVALEVKAMNAVKGRFADASGEYTLTGAPDRELATSLLHSRQYHREKAKVVQPIDEFFTALDNRTHTQFHDRLENLSHSLLLTQGLMAAVVAIALAGFMVVRWRVVKPLEQTRTQLSTIHGSRNLSTHIQVDSKGEIAGIADQINSFIGSLKASLLDTRQMSEQLAGLSEQNQAAVLASQQRANATAAEIDSSASAVEEMSQTLVHVSENTSSAEQQAAQNEDFVELGRTKVHSAIQSMQALSSEFSSTQTVIKKLTQESEEVSNVLSVIRSIAEQTNLLALNAAIEAARAGDMGRGFAVVADEVRSLAQRTQESTQEIEDIVNSLQQRTAEVNGAISNSAQMMEQAHISLDDAVESFASIEASTSAIHNLNTQIASTTEQQSAVSQEVAASIVKIRNNFQEIVQAMAQIEAASRELSSQSQQMQQRSRTYILD